MEPKGEAALAASAKCLMLHAMNLMGKGLRPELTSAMIALGQGHAHRALSIDPASGASWKTLGLIESLRDASGRKEPIPQYRMPFDPMFDLPAIRATYALLRADRLAPNDFMTLVSLLKVFAIREMHEASGPITDRLIASATTRDQGKLLVTLKPEIARAAATAMRAPNTSWKNVGELEQVVAKLLNDGYAESAADVLEKAYPPAQRPWDQTDRIATIRLHLGQPDQARAIWQEAAQVPRPAVRDARVAITYLVEGDFDAARKSLKIALAAEPNSFEAHYGLAILERDAGRANEALASAMSAEKSATTDAARAAAQEIAAFVRPYADVMKSKPAAP